MRRETQKSDSNRYLITYSDLMNLLLILFIVLYCSCSKDVVKVGTVMSAISNSFGGASSSASASAGGGGTNSSSGSGTGSGTGVANDYNDFYKNLIGLINKNGIKDKVDITDTNSEVIITLKDNVLFASGKADLNDSATSLLTNIAGLLKKVNYGQLIIEGHTDSDPIHTAQFQDNTELSLIRAYNVSKIFTSTGINPKKVLPVGYGENYPVAKNDTAANKAKNRRVVITILKRGLTPADDSISADDIISKMNEVSKAAQASSAAKASSSSSSSSSSSQTSSK